MMLMPDFIIIQQKAVGSVWYKLGIEHDLDWFSMMKHCDTKHNVEKKYLFHSLPQITIPSLKVMRTGTQSGHKHGGRRCYIGYREVFLSGLLIMACSACLLVFPRNTNPGMAPSTMDWVLLHQPLLKCLTGLAIA